MFIYLPNVLELDDEFRKRAELFTDSSKEGVVSIVTGSISVLVIGLLSAPYRIRGGGGRSEPPSQLCPDITAFTGHIFNKINSCHSKFTKFKKSKSYSPLSCLQKSPSPRYVRVKWLLACF